MSAKRKTRMDTGRVYRSPRVINVMRWVIEQDVISVPQLQLLLVRYAEKVPTLKQPTEPTLSLVRTLNIIRKWKDAGWIEYDNPYRDTSKPGFVYATRKGLKEFGYENLTYRARELDHLDHLFAVNYVRLYLGLWFKGQGVTNWRWWSERLLRASFPNETKYPDGEVSFAPYHVAVEVETSRKTIAAYEDIRALYEQKSVGSRVWNRAKYYGEVWYFCEDAMEKVLTATFASKHFNIRSFSKLKLEDGSTL